MVLQQDEKAHVEKFGMSPKTNAATRPLYGYVIFQPTAELPRDGLITKVTKQCRIMVEDNPITLFLSISYPSRREDAENIWWHQQGGILWTWKWWYRGWGQLISTCERETLWWSVQSAWISGWLSTACWSKACEFISSLKRKHTRLQKSQERFQRWVEISEIVRIRSWETTNKMPRSVSNHNFCWGHKTINAIKEDVIYWSN